MVERSLRYFSFETRQENLIGLKLLAASFCHQCKESLTIFLTQTLATNFAEWAKYFGGQVSVEAWEPPVYGWGAKPHLCKHVLSRYGGEWVWLDADLIVASNPTPTFLALEREVMVVVEDPALEFDHQRMRALYWGFPSQKTLPHTVNSCVLHFSDAHRQLIDAWCALADDPRFLEAQQEPFEKRPYYLLGDQDLLEGLLIAEPPRGFSNLMLHFFRSGKEVVHDFREFDYKPADRIRNALKPSLVFVHGQGIKPWSPNAPPHRALSAFTGYARRYRESLGECTAWMSCSPIQWVSRIAAFNNPNLQGLPFYWQAKFVQRTRLLAAKVRGRVQRMYKRN